MPVPTPTGCLRHGQVIACALGFGVLGGCSGSDGEPAGPFEQKEPGFYQEISWSPDGTSLLASVLALAEEDPGYTYRIWRLDPDGGEPRPLTDGPRDYWTSWSPDGSRVAFAASVDGALEIMTMGADGSDLRRLTFSDSVNTQPAWSPDGRRIAFISHRDGGAQLWVMNADGTDPKLLRRTSGEAQNPAWSPDGENLAYYETDGDGSDWVSVIRSDGSDPRRLTEGLWPTWMPDGSGLLYSGDSGLFRLPLPGGEPELVVEGDVVAGELSPDGTRLAYIIQDSAAVSIVVADADGEQARALITRPPPGW